MQARRPLLATITILLAIALPTACASDSSQNAQPDKFCPIFKEFMAKPAVIKKAEAAKDDPYDTSYSDATTKLVKDVKSYLPGSLSADVKVIEAFSAEAKKTQYSGQGDGDATMDRSKVSGFQNSSLKLLAYLSTACHVELPGQ